MFIVVFSRTLRSNKKYDLDNFFSLNTFYCSILAITFSFDREVFMLGVTNLAPAEIENERITFANDFFPIERALLFFGEKIVIHIDFKILARILYLPIGK